MWIKVDILSLLGKILENVATFSYMILKLAFLEEKGGLFRFKISKECVLRNTPQLKKWCKFIDLKNFVVMYFLSVY